MEIKQGNFVAQFSENPLSWKVYVSKGLLADARPEDWMNSRVDFTSREAGILLLNHLRDVYADFIEPKAEMLKNDQGVTEDVPPASAENMHPELEMDTDNSAEETLQLIKDILDDADENGCTHEHIAAINELEKIYQMAKKKPNTPKWTQDGKTEKVTVKIDPLKKPKLTPEELEADKKANRGTGAHVNTKEKRKNNPFKQEDFE